MQFNGRQRWRNLSINLMSFSKPVWWVSYRLESRVPRFDNLPQKTGTNAPSFCSTLLEKDTKLTEQFEFDLKWTANSMYGASMDTVRPSRDRFRSMKLTLVQTVTTVCHFVYAMLLHPEILAKAHQEIDSVVGSDRLPTFSDRASLPFGS